MASDRPELEDDYLTVADIAGLLKLNQQTVRNWIDQGSLPAVRVGRRVRIRRADLQRVLDDGYQPGNAQRQPAGPSADDFWGGETVGIAEPALPSGEPGPAAEPAPPGVVAEADQDHGTAS